MWIARDKKPKYSIPKYVAGGLYLFQHKPVLCKGGGMEFWAVDDSDEDAWDEGLIYLDDSMFPEVTFENSPVEVEIKIKNHGKK